VVTQVATTDTTAGTGGVDHITTTGGTNVVLGGVGADVIDAPGGDNIILGDNGEVNLNNHTPGASTDIPSYPDLGPPHSITAGVVIDAPGGDNIVLGDNGVVNLNSATNDVETTQLGLGGDDQITGGANNIILGGFGADTISVGSGTSVILGDNGVVRRDASAR